MKYLLMIHANPVALDALSEQERNAIYAAHDAFVAHITESGELVGFAALADPSNSRTVRVRAGATTVTDGPYIEMKEFLAGYTIVDCETPERAAELAAMIPDAGITGIEVRPVMHFSGSDM
ncbi:YciI family protein [Dactylosporangium fulvum]|uniref:YciI family protein n=1 Tax=Dactylosporangium fulvum TaxID=53359 RepID=A0ABY5VZM4_9ACTN|nr:YciI family protein [Dactylosporangium fulvum]UWP83208.1 YciI family protein [Dactylosporangium fulvum]